MQYINKIELQGKIGTIRVNEVTSKKVANFSLLTEHLIKTKEGNVIAEHSWHNVVVWEGENTDPRIFNAQKGDIVNVTGRTRNNRYTGADGLEKIFTEVLASKLKLVTENHVENQ